MALRRSDSARTTLSVYITRSSKFQRYLGVLNVILLLGSLTLIFFGLVLKLFYLMDQVDFVSNYFLILPWMLMAVGILCFLLATFGFLISLATDSRPLILIYAYLVSLLVVLQISSIFVAMETRSLIASDIFFTNTKANLIGYNEDEGIRSKWDYLQSSMRCCGAFRYSEYKGRASTNYNCVPDSCCYNYQAGSLIGSCSSSIVVDDNNCAQESVLTNHIYVRGCLEIMDKIYRDNLQHLMLMYGFGGTILALVALISVTLACAFAAQIKRRQKREWMPGEDLTKDNVNEIGGSSEANNTLPMDDFVVQ